jgi:hypothetical protein
MALSLRGRVIEHCNCNSICPCFSSGLTRAGDYERCIGFIAFEVDAGELNGVDLAGRRGVFVQDSPPMMAEGNWKVGVIVDAEATDQQAEALASILNGTAGGPMAGFAALTGEFLGIERAPITITHDGDTHTLSVGAMIDAEFKDEIQVEGADPVQLINTPGIPFGPPVTVSPPTKSLIKAFGIEIDNSGRHGTTSEIDWQA